MLFLDEPTTGLDPTARAALWDVVGELTAGGTTVVLTTQYLDEADRLADDIVVLDHGRIAARGTPAELKRLVGGKVVTATIPTGHLDRLADRPDRSAPAGPGHVTVTYSTGDADAAAALVARLAHGRRRARRPRRHVAHPRRRLRPPHPARSPIMTATDHRTTVPTAGDPVGDAARPRSSPATCAPPPGCRSC